MRILFGILYLRLRYPNNDIIPRRISQPYFSNSSFTRSSLLLASSILIVPAASSPNSIFIDLEMSGGRILSKKEGKIIVCSYEVLIPETPNFIR